MTQLHSFTVSHLDAGEKFTNIGGPAYVVEIDGAMTDCETDADALRLIADVAAQTARQSAQMAVVKPVARDRYAASIESAWQKWQKESR